MLSHRQKNPYDIIVIIEFFFRNYFFDILFAVRNNLWNESFNSAIMANSRHYINFESCVGLAFGQEVRQIFQTIIKKL